MPFKSEAQRRWMHAAEARGEVPKGTASRWEHHTKDKKNLPEHVSKEPAVKKTESKKEALDAGDLRMLGLLGGLPALSGGLAAATAEPDNKMRDALATGGGSAIGGIGGLSLGGTLGHYLVDRGRFTGSAKGLRLPVGMILGALGGLGAGQLGGAALGHHLARRGDQERHHEEAEKKAYDIGATAAYATFGLR